ncbi:MAG: hypothetical protein AB8F65_12750 [Woeseiaceae bacterium]
MNKLIRELRRREVFRTAGLYVGICWMLIEVGSVVLPTFGAPEWLFRGAIIIAVAGFPVMLLLAWFFDADKDGIHLQADESGNVAPSLAARKSDFVIIGVLGLALIISLSLNFLRSTPATETAELTSIIVADFNNATGDSTFDNVLQMALVTGLESATHITAYDRTQATRFAAQSALPDDRLDTGLATQLIQQQAVDWLLVGSINSTASDFDLTLDAFNAAEDDAVFSVNRQANSQDEVIGAIGLLASDVKKALGGDVSGDTDGVHTAEFSTQSLAAAKAYAEGRQQFIAGDLESAEQHYAKAIRLDSRFGLAIAELASTEFAVGKTQQARDHWTEAKTLSDTLTQREWLKAQGRYYTSAARDDQKAQAVFDTLFDQYPGEINALKHSALLSVNQRDFEKASLQTQRFLQTYASDSEARMNSALYAMYAGDWETAVAGATLVLEANSEQAIAYLPMAMAAMFAGDPEKARENYQQMAGISKTGHFASLAILGLADLDLFQGKFDRAQERLKSNLETTEDNHQMVALKHLALAQSYAEQADSAAVTAAVERALILSDADMVRISAALIYVENDDLTTAANLVNALATTANTDSRAYRQMLQGMILAKEGAETQAIIAMRDALDTADLWFIRYQLGIAYLKAGNHPEALDEFATLRARQGEAASIFLNEIPTYRWLAELPYWTGRVEEALNIPSAHESYGAYIALRPQSTPRSRDAERRLANLK